MTEACWKFGVIVRTGDRVKYFGLAETYDEALKLQKSVLEVGWQTAKVFDTTLSEVHERPSDKRSLARLANFLGSVLCTPMNAVDGLARKGLSRKTPGRRPPFPNDCAAARIARRI